MAEGSLMMDGASSSTDKLLVKVWEGGSSPSSTDLLHMTFPVQYNLKEELQATTINLGSSEHSKIDKFIILSSGLILCGYSDGQIKWVDIASGKVIDSKKGHEGYVGAIVEVNSDLFATAGSDGVIKFWNSATGAEVSIIPDAHQKPIHSLVIHKNRLVSASLDGTVKVWSLEKDHNLLMSFFERGAGCILELLILPNQILAGIGTQGIKFWNLDTGKAIKIIKGYTNLTSFLALPNGLLACATMGGSVQLIDIATGKTVMAFTGHQHWASQVLRLHNNWLVSRSSDGTIRFWNLSMDIKVFFCSLEHDARWMDLLPDGRLITASRDGGTLHCWDICEYSPQVGSTTEERTEYLSKHPLMLLAQNKLRPSQVSKLLPSNLKEIDVSQSLINDELLEAITKKCPDVEVNCTGSAWLTLSQGEELTQACHSPISQPNRPNPPANPGRKCTIS